MGASHALSKPKARRMGWLFGNVPSKNSLERCSLVKASDLTCLTSLDPPPLVEGHAFVYILACSDGALYIGSASDLRNRLKQHDGTNGAKFTRDHGRQIN